MKIAILAFSALPKMGGAEIFTYNLIQQFSQKGHDVHLYLPRNSYLEFKKMSFKNCTVHSIFFKELGFLNRVDSILNLKILLSQLINNYDVWQVVGVHPTAHLTRYISRKAPVVVRAFGADIQKEESINYGFRLRADLDNKIRYTLSKVSRVTALTPSLAEDFKELGVPENKIVEIPNGVDLERFQEFKFNSIKSELLMSENETLILTTGRYHIKKGYEYIPQAIKILRNRGFNFKWLLVGKGLEKIKKMAIELKVEDTLVIKDEVGVGEISKLNNISVPGDELIRLYKSADFYVLPSLIEGMSNAMLEAMAAGLPVVTTDSPGCRDLVRNEVNGHICKPKNSESLADSVELFFDGNYLRVLKEKVRDYIKSHSWETISNRYLEVYKGLIK